jgi:hypothetical protein
MLTELVSRSQQKNAELLTPKSELFTTSQKKWEREALKGKISFQYLSFALQWFCVSYISNAELNVKIHRES